MARRKYGCLDDIVDADLGYLDDGEIYDGIHFTKPVLVNRVDYEEGVVRFICKDGKMIERKMDQFWKTWWLMKA